MRSPLTALVMGMVLAGAGGALYLAPNTEAAVDLAVCTRVLTPPTIVAQAAYVLDVATGLPVYEKNAEAQLPLASVAKLMTVRTALKLAPPETRIIISDVALREEGEYGLKAREAWSLSDLSSFTLIESSNDGARALAEGSAAAAALTYEQFVDVMNRHARALGLEQTYFLNVTGLDVTTETAGAYGSARDMALLLADLGSERIAAVDRSVLPEWQTESLTGVVHAAKNTALLAAGYGAATVSKTGYTDLAGGNMAFMHEPLPGKPVAISILGSTREDRITDAAALASYAEQVVTLRANCASL